MSWRSPIVFMCSFMTRLVATIIAPWLFMQIGLRRSHAQTHSWSVENQPVLQASSTSIPPASVEGDSMISEVTRGHRVIFRIHYPVRFVFHCHRSFGLVIIRVRGQPGKCTCTVPAPLPLLILSWICLGTLVSWAPRRYRIHSYVHHGLHYLKVSFSGSSEHGTNELSARNAYTGRPSALIWVATCMHSFESACAYALVSNACSQ